MYLFIYVYILGILYSVFINVASNTLYMGISTATTISVMASCIFIVDFIKLEINDKGILNSVFLLFITGIVIFGQVLL